MRLIRQYPILSFSLLFLFVSLSCQAVTNLQSNDTSTTSNTDEIVEQAVATVAAQTAVNPTTPIVDTQLPTVDGDLQSAIVRIYQQVNPSVVHIFIFDNQGGRLGSGSGFVFDENGSIVTNNHVVADGSAIEVAFANGERRRAELMGRDVDSDLAVIQVDNLPTDARPIPLGNSSELAVGEFVITIGNPFGEAGSMSVGIVSGLGRTLDSQRILPGGGRFSIPQVIQTDAAINPGNSGGPLLNMRGEVVGVNSAIQTTTGTNSGVGFSIPADAVRNIAPALIADGRYTYSYIGISMTSSPFTLDELAYFSVPPNGVYVIRVEDGTPAAEAGLIGTGVDNVNVPNQGSDYIIAINGVPVKTSNELLSYLVFETTAGQTVDLTVLRDGTEVNIPLILGERP
ncbi:MAG: trypsin-like serine protease [Chloroflexi bacterium]|nr:trypsin-like serine protease [Chloroflexota bacterium]